MRLTGWLALFVVVLIQADALTQPDYRRTIVNVLTVAGLGVGGFLLWLGRGK